MQRNSPSLNCHTCSGRSKSIFCDLKKIELDKLDSEKKATYYKKGENLFLSGNPPYGLYCVHEGRVKISMTNSDGKETIVRIVGEGGVLGHRSLFSESPYTATATVTDDSVICFVSKQTMQGLIQDDPRLAYKIISRVSDEMGAAEDKLGCMAQKSVRERLAETLLLLKENFGVQEGCRIKLDVILTREELASMVGAASENITRLIMDYKNEDYISQEGKVIYVEDIEALEREASLGY